MKVYKYKPPEELTIDFLIKKCPVESYQPNKPENKLLYFLFCGIGKRVFYKLRMNLIKHYNDIFPNIDTRNLPQYFPIQFEPRSNKNAYMFWSERENLDNQVGEFLYDLKTKEWKLKKLRDDRKIEVMRGNYFGNNYKIAEIIWMNLHDPLVIEDIEDHDTYFQEKPLVILKI